MFLDCHACRLDRADVGNYVSAEVGSSMGLLYPKEEDFVVLP